MIWRIYPWNRARQDLEVKPRGLVMMYLVRNIMSVGSYCWRIPVDVNLLDLGYLSLSGTRMCPEGQVRYLSGRRIVAGNSRVLCSRLGLLINFLILFEVLDLDEYSSIFFSNFYLNSLPFYDIFIQTILRLFI